MNELIDPNQESRDAFPPEHPAPRPLSWGGQSSEIPPVLVVRMRLLA